MRPSTLIVAAVAVVFGLVAAIAAQISMRQSSDAPTEEKVTLAVAKEEIPASAPLDITKFTEKKVDKEALGPSDILWGDLEERLKGDKKLTTKMTIGKGTHLQEFMLGQDLTIQSILRPGFRAVSIPVRDESNAVGAWALPGNFVDVQWIYRYSRAGQEDGGGYAESGGAQVNTLLRNVKILAMGNVISSSGDVTDESGSKSRTAKVRHVTLECTPEGAKKLRLAAETGELALTLRSMEEDASEEEEETAPIVSLKELLGDTGADLPQPDVSYRDELAELERRIQSQIDKSREQTLSEMQVNSRVGRDIPIIVGQKPPAGFENSLLRIRTLRGAQPGELMIYVPSNEQ